MTVTRAGSFSRPEPASEDAEGLSLRLCDHPDAASAIGPEAFFALRFGLAAAGPPEPGIVRVPLAPLGCDPSWAVWNGPPIIMRETSGGIAVVATANHIVVHGCQRVAPRDDLAAVTSALYLTLLRRVQALGYPHLLRVWNFVPGINRGSGDRENYLLFNRGRSAVFDGLALPAAKYPAATVVGSAPGTPLTVIVLASRIEPLAVENPRQISPYHYPRQYGPCPPAFARAMLLPHRLGATVFISGTASIVGHESRHREIGPQLAEALVNLETLKAAACAHLPGYPVRSPGSWLIYLRNSEDRERIAGEVMRRLGDRAVVAFLQADICRRELLVEIEGAYELSAGGGAQAA